MTSDDGAREWCDDCHGYTHRADCPATASTTTAAIRAAAERLRGSITFVELIGVLERLRSKHKTPNQWYEGWNAAIDCLIRDATAATTPPPATSEQCTECRHKFCSDCEEACCKCDWPMRPAPSVPAGEKDDGWVTFGTIKTDIENETQTFERVSPEPAPSSGDAARSNKADANENPNEIIGHDEH